ncbi:MAG TPA: ABC transporter substrate-binding protein [Micromonosporaceae bacterium]|jgi:iron(III) transport system substrate-binding protein
MSSVHHWNKRILPVVLIAMVATVGACGSSGSTPAASGATGGSKSLALKTAPNFSTAPPQSLIDQAKQEGSLIWYDSTPADKAPAVLAAFQKDYPFVTNVKHIQLRSGDAETHVLQESAAGATTADVIFTNITTIIDGQKRGLIKSEDWQSYGVPAELTPTNYAVAVTAAVTCLVYNTNLVSAADAPTTWQDLLKPAFNGGKIGIWTNPDELLPLIQSWGEPAANKYYQSLFAQQPKQYATGSAAVVQAVEAGEIPIGVSTTNVVQPELDKGAPIKMVIADPVPVDQLFDSVTTKGKDPAVGALFVSWLTTQDGAAAYAAANSRTSPFLPNSTTDSLFGGKQLVGFVPSEAQQLVTYEKMFTAELGSK